MLKNGEKFLIFFLQIFFVETCDCKPMRRQKYGYINDHWRRNILIFFSKEK